MPESKNQKFNQLKIWENTPLEKQKELRKGTDHKKMYYSHKRVNLKLKNDD